MKTVKMTKTTPGARDGVTIEQFNAGQTYDLPGSLADAFVSMGVAKSVVETPENSAVEIETPEKKTVKRPGK